MPACVARHAYDFPHHRVAGAPSSRLVTQEHNSLVTRLLGLRRWRDSQGAQWPPEAATPDSNLNTEHDPLLRVQVKG